MPHCTTQMEVPVSDEEEEGQPGVAQGEDDFMVGPPPPEIAEELDLGERSAAWGSTGA